MIVIVIFLKQPKNDFRRNRKNSNENKNNGTSRKLAENRGRGCNVVWLVWLAYCKVIGGVEDGGVCVCVYGGGGLTEVINWHCLLM